VARSIWPSSVPLGGDEATRRVDLHTAELLQVDLHAAFAGGLAGMTVTAAFHREQQIVLAREPHRCLYVRDVDRLHDECRTLVERGIPRLPTCCLGWCAARSNR